MGALLLTGEEVGADATGDVDDEVCDVRAVVGSVALRAARINRLAVPISDFMQPVFALTSIAGRLSSGQMKEPPVPGTSGATAADAGTVDIGGDITVNRLGFGAMRITGRGIWGRTARPEPGSGRAAAGRRAWRQLHRHRRRLRPQR